MVAALEVVVGEDGAAHDGQIGVGADEVVGELIDEVKHAHKAVVGDAHGHVFVVEYDAVLAVVEVGGILHVPALAVERQRDHAVVLPRGEADAARVAGVLRAEHALGIAGLLGAALRGNVARVLFRLGEVDGDLQLPGLGVLEKAHVFGDAVHLDVVAVAAEPVEPLRGRRGAAFPVQSAKKRSRTRCGSGVSRPMSLAEKRSRFSPLSAMMPCAAAAPASASSICVAVSGTAAGA